MKIFVTSEINCEPKDLFPWIADPDKAMKWQKNVKGGEIIKKTKSVIGTTFKEEVEENGRVTKMRGEITKYKKNELIGFHLESSMHKADVDYTIRKKGNRSVFSAIASIKWKFPMNIISLFIGRRIKEGVTKQTKSEFEELKKLCERA